MTPPSLHKSTITHAKIKIPSKPPPSSDDIPTTLTRNTTTNTLFTTLPPYNDARPNEPITECIIRPEIKDTILAIPGFPHPFTTPDPPRYEIKLIRGAGMGMIATVDLDVGDVILVERPLLVTTQLLQRAGQLPWQHPHHLQRMVVERMPKETAEEFFALHNCKGYTQPSITGIFNTNAIGIGALPGYPADCGAVCKVISRVNHSCSPTATWAFHVESFAVQLRAILPIRKGEEVFVNYGTRGQRLEERQQYLLRRYKFKCACPPCASPSRESDQIRVLVERATLFNVCGDDSSLRRWVNDPTKPDDLILAECHTIIKMLDDERYYNHHVWSVWYQRIVKAYCALEDEKNATKWAEKAAKLHRAFAFGDGGWDAVAKDPKNTDWWGLRTKTRSGTRLFKNLENVNVQKELEYVNAKSTN